MSDIKLDSGLEDLRKFVRIGNRTLLVKGRSGTGKVTLCFELARLYKDKFNVIFISHKVNEHDLYNRFPWIKDFVKKDNIVSISDTDGLIDNTSFIVTNLINILANLTTKIEDPFVGLGERTKPFIILDAWDSITKEIDVTTRIKVEKLLVSLTDKQLGFLVFLTEESENPTLEYLVDGIVHLTQNFYKSYRLREMSIEKLRGTHILKPKVPFTLEGGRFRTFSRMSHEITNSPKKFIAIPHSERFYSTGNIELDEKLNGGFKRGSVVSLEIGEEVDRFVFVPLLTPLVLNFIAQRTPAMVISSTDQHVSAVTRYIIPHIDRDLLDGFLRVLGSDIGEAAPYLVSITADTFEDVYRLWLKYYMESHARAKGSLTTVDYSFVELKYQNDIQEILKSIVDLCRMVRASGDLLLMSSRPNYKTLEVMKSVSDVHLKVFEYDGVTMLAAIKPQLFVCNIQTDYSQGFPSAILHEST